MKAEIAKLWVSELRSGKYKQGTAYLKTGGCYCCLGVLCEMSNLSAFDHTGSYFKEDMRLPEAVQEWSGMWSDIGEFWSKGAFSGLILNGYVNLSKANDSGASFNQIADFIEANYEIL